MVPSIAIGGITILTRLPSAKRASQVGVDSSTLRPTRLAIRFAISISCCSLIKLTFTFSTNPSRSINTFSCPLIMMSVMLSSSIKFCNGPKPTSSFTKLSTNSFFMIRETGNCSLSINNSTALSSCCVNSCLVNLLSASGSNALNICVLSWIYNVLLFIRYSPLTLKNRKIDRFCCFCSSPRIKETRFIRGNPIGDLVFIICPPSRMCCGALSS